MLQGRHGRPQSAERAVGYVFFLAAKARATADRMSATENGLVMTSCTMALSPEARSR
jgi:hypothetical protein